MINVFISSTYIDCIEYRNVAKEAVESFGKDELNVIGMELFGARKDTTLKVCMDEVERSNVYILIVAHRYGSIEKLNKKSYTQLEYEAALELNIPILVYILDNSVLVKPSMVDKQANFTKLKKFKDRLLRTHTCQFFCNEFDLKHKIIADLARELKYDIPFNDKLDFDDMNLTPSNYHGKEFIIDFEISDYFNKKMKENKLDPQIIEKLNLTKGNCLVTNIKVITDNSVYENSILICQNFFTKWLKDIANHNNHCKYLEESSEEEISIFRAKVQIVFTTYNDEVFDDDGKVVYITEEFKGCLLLEKPKVVKQYRVKLSDEILF